MGLITKRSNEATRIGNGELQRAGSLLSCNVSAMNYCVFQDSTGGTLAYIPVRLSRMSCHGRTFALFDLQR